MFLWIKLSIDETKWKENWRLFGHFFLFIIVSLGHSSFMCVYSSAMVCLELLLAEPRWITDFILPPKSLACLVQQCIFQTKHTPPVFFFLPQTQNVKFWSQLHPFKSGTPLWVYTGDSELRIWPSVCAYLKLEFSLLGEFSKIHLVLIKGSWFTAQGTEILFIQRMGTAWDAATQASLCCPTNEPDLERQDGSGLHTYSILDLSADKVTAKGGHGFSDVETYLLLTRWRSSTHSMQPQKPLVRC